MNQLSMPLERPPQLDLQSSALLGPSSNSSTLTSPQGPWGADAISSWPAELQNENQPPNPAGFGNLGSTLGLGGLGSLVQQLVGLLQQLMQMLSGNGTAQAASSNPATANPEEYFQQAAGNSQGDPHLSFSGLDGSNHLETSRFDSMTDHPDLLDSNSFAGRYQLSTRVGTPNASGATLNQSATITTNFGRTRVSLDGSGNASVTECGKSLALTAGQTLDLGHGQTVTKNGDGSLTVVNTNNDGGRISTTLKPNAIGGVDVSADANGINLGGDLVTEAQNNNGGIAPQNLPGSFEPQPRFWFGPNPNQIGPLQ
jgi:hypothetical protein